MNEQDREQIIEQAAAVALAALNLLDDIRRAATKLANAFPETIRGDSVQFDIPAYIVRELRDAIFAFDIFAVDSAPVQGDKT